MIITRVVYNSITFRVSAGPPFRAWIRRTEVTSVLSDEARTAILALIPPRRLRTSRAVTTPDLDSLMRQAHATNETLAVAAGFAQNTIARARGGEKVFASTAEVLYQTLREKSFNYKKRGRLRHGEIGM